MTLEKPKSFLGYIATNPTSILLPLGYMFKPNNK